MSDPGATPSDPSARTVPQPSATKASSKVSKKVSKSAAVHRPWFRRMVQRAWWHLLHLLCYVYFVPMYRFRSWGVEHVPRTGPVMLVSNHQSHLDPIIVGLPMWWREFYAMARSTLFDYRSVAWLIRSLNAIPIDREGTDATAIRLCLDVLKANKVLIVFAEGTRTETGVTNAFETGTLLLARRSKATIVPVALDGAFDVWRRGRSRPKLTGRIGVMFGEAISPETLVAMKPDEAMTMLQNRVEAMRLEISQRIGTPKRGQGNPEEGIPKN